MPRKWLWIISVLVPHCVPDGTWGTSGRKRLPGCREVGAPLAPHPHLPLLLFLVLLILSITSQNGDSVLGFCLFPRQTWEAKI